MIHSYRGSLPQRLQHKTSTSCTTSRNWTQMREFNKIANQKNLTNVQRNIWTIENPTNIPLLITSFFNYVDTANIIVVVECCIMGCRHIYLKHYDINKIALCHLKYVHKGRNVNNILKNKNMIVRKNLISNLIHQRGREDSDEPEIRRRYNTARWDQGRLDRTCGKS